MSKQQVEVTTQTDDFDAIIASLHGDAISVSEDENNETQEEGDGGSGEIERIVEVETLQTVEVEPIEDTKKTKAETIKKPKTFRAFIPKDNLAMSTAKTILGDAVYDLFVQDMQTQPIKIAEKIYNALCFIAGRSSLSVYTANVYSLFYHEKEPLTFTMRSLTDYYINMGYSEGTAGSQAQQVWHVMQILGLAETSADGKTISRIAAASVIAKHFEEALKARPLRFSKKVAK